MTPRWSVRPAGTAVIIGIPAVDRISLWAHQLRRKELNIIMSRRSSFELEPAIRLMAPASSNRNAWSPTTSRWNALRKACNSCMNTAMAY